MDKKNKYALILGAGPCGLALAYELIALNSQIKPIIIEKLPVTGGLARTVYDGKSGIDIGGHRFFTKNKYIIGILEKFLTLQNAPSVDDFLAHRNLKYPKTGADPNFRDDVLLIRKRFSSILKNKKQFQYPLRLNFKTFQKLGLIGSVCSLFSYFKALILKKTPNNVENFLINRFGAYLYNIFFKEHTKKIWGVDASEICNNWEKNRIQRSLIAPPKLWEDEYYYPKYGCSQLWDKMAKYILDNGGDILLNTEFLEFNTNADKIISARVKQGDLIKEINADYFISTIAISDLIKGLDAPYDIKQHALNLPYRDYILVSFFSEKFNLKNNTKYPTINDI
ncbi:FAD-dependent oxidoreductase, partial [bacterium]|nr:FAD-dependent oxidoreductase [bacterium]